MPLKTDMPLKAADQVASRFCGGLGEIDYGSVHFSSSDSVERVFTVSQAGLSSGSCPIIHNNR